MEKKQSHDSNLDLLLGVDGTEHDLNKPFLSKHPETDGANHLDVVEQTHVWLGREVTDPTKNDVTCFQLFSQLPATPAGHRTHNSGGTAGITCDPAISRGLPPTFLALRRARLLCLRSNTRRVMYSRGILGSARENRFRMLRARGRRGMSTTAARVHQPTAAL